MRLLEMNMIVSLTKFRCLLQKDEFLRLIINSVRNDLISRNEAFQCLALSFAGNGGLPPTIHKHGFPHSKCVSLPNVSVKFMFSSAPLSLSAVGGQEMAALLTIDVMNLLVRTAELPCPARIASKRQVGTGMFKVEVYALFMIESLGEGKWFGARTVSEWMCGQSQPDCWAVMQTNGAARPIVRKKAATCLLRLIRKSPPEAELMPPELWSVKLVR